MTFQILLKKTNDQVSKLITNTHNNTKEFNKPFLKAAAGKRLNPCENRLVSLLDKANIMLAVLLSFFINPLSSQHYNF